MAVKTMFTLTIFEILLLKGKSVLWSSQWIRGSERVKLVNIKKFELLSCSHGVNSNFVMNVYEYMSFYKYLLFIYLLISLIIYLFTYFFFFIYLNWYTRRAARGSIFLLEHSALIRHASFFSYYKPKLK